jgi:hypothetical protein
MHTGVWWENARKVGVDGEIILRWIFRKWDGGGMDWIGLVQDRDRWWAVVNAVMNFLFY